MQRNVRSNEEGAVAILYSVALLMMLGLLALTIDMGALRYDRAQSQSIADMASVAGALDMVDVADGNPQKACRTAWNYFLANSAEDPVPPEVTCGTFPTSAPDPCDTAAAPLRVATGQTAHYEVRIYWPVHDGADLDGYEFDAGDPELDGEDPCERIAVRIFRTRGFVFGGVVGQTQGSTGAPAVARAVTGEEGKDVASLLLLDKVGCNALAVTGQGKVRVIAAEDTSVTPPVWKPGMIYLDSDASACTGNSYTINTNSVNNYIVAEGDDGNPPEPGVIRLFAQPAGASECQGHACDGDKDMMDPYDLAGHGIWPQPINLPERTNRTPADHRYNCKPDYAELDGQAPGGLDWDVPACEEDHGNYIDQLETAFQDAHATNPDPYHPTTNPDGFKTWTVEGHSCSPANVSVPGNWYVDCTSGTGFNISGSVEFTGGNVIFKGDVKLNAGASLTVNSEANSTTNLPEGCASDLDAECRRTSSRGAAIAYFAGDADLTASDGTLKIHHTMVFLQDGSVGITSNASFDWTAPTEGPFEDLALWSENPDENSLVGQGAVLMDGVYFTPNSLTKLAGGGNSNPYNAQFFTWKMSVAGQGVLLLEPDPARNLPVKTFEGVLLIR